MSLSLSRLGMTDGWSGLIVHAVASSSFCLMLVILASVSCYWNYLSASQYMNLLLSKRCPLLGEFTSLQPVLYHLSGNFKVTHHQYPSSWWLLCVNIKLQRQTFHVKLKHFHHDCWLYLQVIMVLIYLLIMVISWTQTHTPTANAKCGIIHH